LAEKRLSRRKFHQDWVALGVGTAGSWILAACGGGSEGPDKQTIEGGLTDGVQGAAQSAGGAMTQRSTLVAEIPEEAPIARVADVPRGATVEFTDAQLQQPAVLMHLDDGDFAAYSAVHIGVHGELQGRQARLSAPRLSLRPRPRCGGRGWPHAQAPAGNTGGGSQ
jgi:hypothetical protein